MHPETRQVLEETRALLTVLHEDILLLRAFPNACELLVPIT